jgi:hypothetical protein
MEGARRRGLHGGADMGGGFQGPDREGGVGRGDGRDRCGLHGWGGYTH